MEALQLGNLNIMPAMEHLELLAKPVAERLTSLTGTSHIGVAEIDASFSDTAQFSEHYGVGMDQAVNCIVLEAKRLDKSWFAACIVLGNTKADVNGEVRRTLDVKRISFAPMEQAVTQTGMEYGAITPVGLPEDWVIMIDQAVIDTDHVVLGSGIRRSKLIVPGSFLASLPNAIVVKNLARPRA